MKAAQALSRILLTGWLAGCLAGAQGSLAAEGGDGEFAEATLAGVYELALENDLTLAEARAELRIGREERKLALAGLLPQIQGEFGYTESDIESRGEFPAGSQLFPNATNSDAETHRWSASLRQPLFDLPAWFSFKRGVELSNQAQATFSVAQQQLIVRAVEAYFEVLRASANLQASRAQESALSGQLEQVKQRFEVGMVAITDVHEAQAGHDLAVAQRIADEGQVDIARELLTVLTGRSHGELWVLEDEFPIEEPEPATGADWAQFARQNNFDIKVAQYARDAAQRGARAAATEHLPKVDLSLSYTESNTDIMRDDLITGTQADFPSDEDRGVVALNVTLPLFTGGATSAARRQASAQYETRMAGYQGTLRTVIQETRAAHRRVLSDVARSNARAQAVTSTRSALEAAEVGYEVGTRNVVDVLGAQQEFFSAVRDYNNSIIDYVVNLVRLKRLAGTLSPEDVYELNQWLERPPDPTLSGQDVDS